MRGFMYRQANIQRRYGTQTLSHLIPSSSPVAVASGLGVFEFLALFGREFRLV